MSGEGEKEVYVKIPYGTCQTTSHTVEGPQLVEQLEITSKVNKNSFVVKTKIDGSPETKDKSLRPVKPEILLKQLQTTDLIINSDLSTKTDFQQKDLQDLSKDIFMPAVPNGLINIPNDSKCTSSKALKRHNYNPPTQLFESSKIELSFKRLLNCSSFVRKNVSFIKWNRNDANFSCILCSKCIPYSPQKFVLAMNFNTHFKSAEHFLNVGKISKMENVPKCFEMFQIKQKKICRLNSCKSVTITERKAYFKIAHKTVGPKTSSPAIATKRHSHHGEAKPIQQRTKPVYFKKRQTAIFTKTASVVKTFIEQLKLLPYNNPSQGTTKVVLLQQFCDKQVPIHPPSQLSKQFIKRKQSHFYCTLCSKWIYFPKHKYLIKKGLNAHIRSSMHSFRFKLKQSEKMKKEQNRSFDSRYTTKISSGKNRSLNNIENNDCNIIKNGKTLFKEIHNILVKTKDEELFFCNYCVKYKKTAPLKSFEYSITEHCLRVHKSSKKKKDEDVTGDVVWCNNVLKANIRFIEISRRQSAVCSLCHESVTYSKNYNKLIHNFFLHFQDNGHKQAIRSRNQKITFEFVGERNRKYKLNLKEYDAIYFD